MDNLTHTLIGLAEGQLATRLVARRDPGRAARLRPALWLVSALANNVPDLDLFLAQLTPGRLGYLLHHRGYTHTLGGLPLDVALVALLFLAGTRLRRAHRRPRFERRDLLPLGLAASLGVVLHIAFDSLNSYGVHPWWPLSSRWGYGDSVFIAEPTLWVWLTPALYFDAQSRAARAGLAAIFAAALALCVFTGYVPWQLTLALIAIGFWSWGLMLKLAPGARATAAALGAVAVVSAFVATGRIAAAEVRGLLAREFPEARQLDVALSPYPANPLCWTVSTVETQLGWYFSRQGVYAPAPTLLGAAECPELRGSDSRAFALDPVPGPQLPALVWIGQYQRKLDDLRRLAAASCQARAAFRFLRIPAFADDGEGGVIMGDLRFDRGRRSSFASLKIDKAPGGDCPPHVPGWGMPRADLLGL